MFDRILFMTNSEVQKIINDMVQKIVDHVKPDKIILFGSYARGNAGPDSDVDFIVALPVKKGFRRKKAVEIYTLLANSNLPKDIIVVNTDDLEKYRDVPGTIFHPALKEGKILYDRAA